jgi:hypothetical protein
LIDAPVLVEDFFAAGMVAVSATGAASEFRCQPITVMAAITAIIPMKRVAG